jgi:hypothetical protein
LSIMNRGLRCTRAGAAGLVVAVALSVAVVAAPAPAQTTSPSAASVCTRAQRQWDRLVTLNGKAKNAFARAQALQSRLLRAGRVLVAHRLDQRLAHLRSIHATLVARVQAIAARVQGRCSDRAPALTSF